MNLLLIVVQNTEEVAKPLPFLEHQTLWSSLLQHNVPVWRLWDGEHLKRVAGKVSFLKHYPQSELFHFFFLSPSFPFVLDNIRSVSFPVYIDWKQQGLTLSKIAPRVCSKGCDGVERKLNLRGQGTGIRQSISSGDNRPCLCEAAEPNAPWHSPCALVALSKYSPLLVPTRATSLLQESHSPGDCVMTGTGESDS